MFGFLMVALAAVGSLVFLCLPGSADLLYLGNTDENHGIGLTCINQAEWTWMFFSNALIFFPTLLPRSTQACSCSSRRVWVCLVSLNLLWFLAALNNSNLTLETVGAKAAWPALWNLAIVVFPVQRRSQILQRLGGLSHRDCLQFHMWTGRAFGVWLLVHTVVLSVSYWLKAEDWFSAMIPYQNLFTEGVVNFVGWIGGAMYAGLWVFSLPCFRRCNYECFLVSHLVFSALFVFFSNLHDYNTMFFVQPAWATWMCDQLLRQHHKTTVTSVLDTSPARASTMIASMSLKSTCRIVALTFEVQSSCNIPTPGSVVYLKSLQISQWQSHPFSVALSDPENRSYTVYVKALGDWTTQFVQTMKQRVLQADNAGMQLAPLQLEIEGPYASHSKQHLLDQSSRFLFIAGGVGLTGLCHFAISTHIRGNQPVTLVWLVRTHHEAEVFMETVIRRFQSPSLTKVRVFITEEQSPVELSCYHAPCNPLLRWRSTRLDVIYNREEASWKGAIAMGASIVCTILSFVLARQMSCNLDLQGINDTGDSVRLHQCSLLGVVSDACTMCEIGEHKEEQQVPCCTVKACFYAFRGFPVLLEFLLAPLLLALLWGMWQFLTARGNVRQVLAARDSSASEENLSSMVGANAASTTIMPSAAYEELPDDQCSNGAVHVEHRRPTIAEILSSYATDTATNLEGVEGQTAIVVCGPDALVKDVVHHSASLPNAVVIPMTSTPT